MEDYERNAMKEQGELITESNALAVRPEATTPMGLLQIATENGADIEKLKALMDLQFRWEANEARKEFAKDFAAMKPNLPKVMRTKQNQQTNSMYAPLEDINAAIDPILKEYGFSTATKIVAQTEAGVTIKAELWHRAGHVEETQITMPLDATGIAGKVNKTGPWALSSSVTYGRRYAICALLNISTGDDTDGQSEGVDRTWLMEQLDWIENSRNPEELKKLYSQAFKEAQKASDKTAMQAIVEAKDKKKREFAA